jgi:hypothetical protein
MTADTTLHALRCVRLAELELVSAARIVDLLAPGHVLLRLAVAGSGVVLPPPAQGWGLDGPAFPGRRARTLPAARRPGST